VKRKCEECGAHGEALSVVWRFKGEKWKEEYCTCFACWKKEQDCKPISSSPLPESEREDRAGSEREEGVSEEDTSTPQSLPNRTTRRSLGGADGDL